MEETVKLQDYQTLVAKLQSYRDSSNPDQVKLVELFITDPEGTALRTFSATAKLAKVTPTALNAFVTELGFVDYDSLIEVFRAWLRAELSLENVGQIAPSELLDQLLITVLAKERLNLAKTFANIDPKVWKDIVSLLSAAGQIYIIGLRKSLPVAQMLYNQLRFVRPGINLLTPLEGSLTDVLSSLSTKEVMVAVAMKKYTKQTVQALQYAKRRGLVTIALTDSDESPLAKIADHTLIAETGSVTVLSSITALHSIAQALVTATALKRGTGARAEWQNDEKLLNEFGVYHS